MGREESLTCTPCSSLTSSCVLEPQRLPHGSAASGYSATATSSWPVVGRRESRSSPPVALAGVCTNTCSRPHVMDVSAAAHAVDMNIDCPPCCLTRDFVVVNLLTGALFEWFDVDTVFSSRAPILSLRTDTESSFTRCVSDILESSRSPPFQFQPRCSCSTDAVQPHCLITLALLMHFDCLRLLAE